MFRGSTIHFTVTGSPKYSTSPSSLSLVSVPSSSPPSTSLPGPDSGKESILAIFRHHLYMRYRCRPLRAGVFIFFGLSGIAPATHYGVVNGWQKSLDEAALGWLILMGVLYITGALLYAMRIPERFFPGKVDIWVRKCARSCAQMHIQIWLILLK